MIGIGLFSIQIGLFSSRMIMAEKGRLHKDAARTQLARVCLYYGTYMKYHKETGSEGLTAEGLITKAKELTDEIINSGKYAIVKGTDAGAGTKSYEGYPLSYANQFVQEDLADNKEAIMVRFYETGILTHETGRQAGGNGMGLSKDFIESFLMKDGTPIYNQGSGYQGDEELETEIAIERNTWFHLGANSNQQFIYSLRRMLDPIKEHVDNNFNPLPAEYIKEFAPVRQKINDLMRMSCEQIETSRYENYRIYRQCGGKHHQAIQ